MSDCLIAFGGNLSNPKLAFQSALVDLGANGFHLLAKSGLWRSPAWPAGSDQPDYLNAVVKGTFSGEALELLDIMQAIEGKYGRVRGHPNAARTLDLDLITFGSENLETERLTLPHPRMLERAFVLIPASEFDSKWLSFVNDLPMSDIRATTYVGTW